jgi:hypothetical protein
VFQRPGSDACRQSGARPPSLVDISEAELRADVDPDAVRVARAIRQAAALLSEATAFANAQASSAGGADSADSASSLSEAMRCLALRDIETDLPRTFPDHPAYCADAPGGRAGLVPSLRRVLLAYSKRNTQVGYCQGMNFVAAMLLTHMSEEMAFWCLAVICEDYFEETYTLDMAGAHLDSLILEGLCRGQACASASPHQQAPTIRGGDSSTARASYARVDMDTLLWHRAERVCFLVSGGADEMSSSSAQVLAGGMMATAAAGGVSRPNGRGSLLEIAERVPERPKRVYGRFAASMLQVGHAAIPGVPRLVARCVDMGAQPTYSWIKLGILLTRAARRDIGVFAVRTVVPVPVCGRATHSGYTTGLGYAVSGWPWRHFRSRSRHIPAARASFTSGATGARSALRGRVEASRTYLLCHCTTVHVNCPGRLSWS